tara:strand:- start:1162 stop:1473 length:312 start_codon:yes stop_codon:yes gene_type:complete
MSILLGNKLKELREEKQMPQRQLAAVLEIDTATYCKIEKGDRRAKREQVDILAKLLDFDKKKLVRLWSADKVYEIIADDDDASNILNIVAENIVAYKRKTTKV